MSKSMIEKIKNYSLVALFLSTVLLLYFFWGNLSFDDINFQNEQTIEEPPKTDYLIKPEQIIVNFGADNYTVILPEKRDIWYNDGDKSCMVNEIDRFGQADDILVEEITYDKYQEVMKKYRSIRAEFSYNIPISDFCRNFDINKPQSYNTIQTVTIIGYSTAVEKNLFVFDGKNNKYYRLVAGENKDNIVDPDFPGLIASIESEGYNSYYPISIYSGVENDALTLVPVSLETNLKSFPYRQDTYSYQAQKINALAENFFGENFDFVRRIIEDNGTVIYMYGYGQNVLIVNTDGSIEYKEEQTNDKIKQSFLDALNTAIQYVAKHGSFKSLDGAKLTPYLKDAILNPAKEEGYRFVFGMEVNENRLFYEEGDAIVVDVISGQVTYYKRNMIDFDQEELDTIETYSAEDVFSSVNLIAQNYQYIFNILLQSGEVETTTDSSVMFEEIASLVSDMQIGYVRLSDKDVMEIQPVWVVTINDLDIFFDLYSAEPISYSKK